MGRERAPRALLAGARRVGERGDVLLDIASQFAEETDATDLTTDEGAQHLVDEYLTARYEYHQKGLKLARAVVRGLYQYDAEEKVRMAKAGKPDVESN